MLSGGAKLGADEMRHLWNKARASVTGDLPPEDSKKTLTLEMRPEEVKVLYARALALQSLVDGWLDPREIEYLYVFMSQLLQLGHYSAVSRGVSLQGGDHRRPRPTSALCRTLDEEVFGVYRELHSHVAAGVASPGDAHCLTYALGLNRRS
jgi:hypothetical protein